MGSERWEFYVWVPRYFDLEDVIQMSEKQNGAIEIQTGASVWSKKGQEREWVKGGWPPRRVKITVEEIDQPLEGWGPLC